jgi:hypothetical protein
MHASDRGPEERRPGIEGATSPASNGDRAVSGSRLAVCDFVVTNPGVMGLTVRQVMDLNPDSGFVISRFRNGADVDIARLDTLLERGDVVAVVGDAQALRRAGHILGEASPSHIELDRSELDYRRVFISSREVVGKRFGSSTSPIDGPPSSRACAAATWTSSRIPTRASSTAIAYGCSHAGRTSPR